MLVRDGKLPCSQSGDGLSQWRHLALAVLVVYWVMLFVGTHVPRMPRAVELVTQLDKLCHFAAFAGLAFLVSIAWRLRRPSDRPLRWRNLAIVWVLLVIYGAFDELTQPLVGRSRELIDWAADASGTLFGVLAFAAAASLLRRERSSDFVRHVQREVVEV